MEYDTWQKRGWEAIRTELTTHGYVTRKELEKYIGRIPSPEEVWDRLHIRVMKLTESGTRVLKSDVCALLMRLDLVLRETLREERYWARLVRIGVLEYEKATADALVYRTVEENEMVKDFWRQLRERKE